LSLFSDVAARPEFRHPDRKKEPLLLPLRDQHEFFDSSEIEVGETITVSHFCLTSLSPGRSQHSFQVCLPGITLLSTVEVQCHLWFGYYTSSVTFLPSGVPVNLFWWLFVHVFSHSNTSVSYYIRDWFRFEIKVFNLIWLFYLTARRHRISKTSRLCVSCDPRLCTKNCF